MKILTFICLGLICGASALAQPADKSGMATPLADNEAMSGRTVRLAFRFDPPGAGDRPMVVVSTGGRYGVTVDYEAANHVAHVQITGRLRSLDDGNVIVTFDAELSMKDKESGGATLAAAGSVRLATGKEKTIAAIGDRSLVVTATVEDEK